ncbi:MAG: uroporphyrinogen decarboxylase family protein [Lentisphaerota bacterium]
MTQMTSRERVLAALNHRQPDRVPIDLSGHRSSGIAAIAYARLKKELGICSGGIYVYDMLQQLAIVETPVLDRFGIDTIEMGRGFCLNDSDWQDWILPDGTYCKVPAYLKLVQDGEDWYLNADDGTPMAVMKRGMLYFEQIYFPLMERGIEEDDFKDLPAMCARTMWAGVPHPGAHFPLDAAGLVRLAEGARMAHENSGGRAVIGLFGANMFELPQWLYRMDNYLLYMALYPDAVMRLSESLCAMYMANLEKWLPAVAPFIDVILFGDDLGSQNAPLLSPAMYREYYKPYHRKLWRRVKELAPHVKILLHSCGAIEPLLEDLIDAGLDAVNPVQISCTGMDAAALKRKYAGRLTLWGGGCDTRNILPDGAPEQIYRHVKEQCSILNPGGGFVFQQVHNIMANVPPENIITMFDALKK